MALAFISCGQRPAERTAAEAMCQVFTKRGIRPYVAIAAQSIQDLDLSIIAQLKRSDYFVFVDFRRDKLPDRGDEKGQYRGSVFCHQELAIAYALGFEQSMFFAQRGTILEGISKYIASNAEPFEDEGELPSLIEKAIVRRGWTPSYSRSLVIQNLTHRPNGAVLNYGGLIGRFFYVDICNRRPETGAFGTVARLASITAPDGGRRPSPIRSHLKVAGHVGGYEQTIWPLSHGAVDLFCVAVPFQPQEPPPLFDARIRKLSSIYLNTALDVPQTPILTEPGIYELGYEVFAEGFPVAEFAIRLEFTRDAFATSAVLLARH